MMTLKVNKISEAYEIVPTKLFGLVTILKPYTIMAIEEIIHSLVLKKPFEYD